MESKILWNIEKRKVNELKEFNRNPRKITEKGLKDLKISLTKFGVAEPIVINKDGIICGGHGRKKALQELGVKEVDVYIPDRLLNDKEFRELNVRLNKNIAGIFDFDILSTDFELEELYDIGFTPEELDISIEEEDGLTEDDEVPPPPVMPVNVQGDCWRLGKHKLICGDSTMLNVLDKLCADIKIDMVFTDPPYGLGGYGGRNKMELKGDELDPKQFYHAIPINIPEVYVWGRIENLFDINFKPRDTIVWKKNNFGLGRGYRGQYELCFYKGLFKGSDSDVWEVNKDTDYVHPTQKPVELAVRAIKNSKPKTILDLFLGSGSTLIACEKTGVTCYGIELSESYCDVIIERWQKFTGEDAVHEGGKTFNEMKDNIQPSMEHKMLDVAQNPGKLPTRG